MTGQLDEAVTTIDEAAILVERNGDSFYMPEILRIKGDILASARPMDEAEIEECFSRSLAWASRESAMSLALRTAMTLARLWHRQGRLDEARSLLSSVYDRFTEGFEAADLKAATRLLDELDRRTNPGKDLLQLVRLPTQRCCRCGLSAILLHSVATLPRRPCQPLCTRLTAIPHLQSLTPQD